MAEDRRYTFTVNDRDLALWLKENAGKDDYIAQDVFEYDGFRKEEGIGVFSERYIWNDGQYEDETEAKRRRELVTLAFENDRLEDLKKEGVSYLIETKSQNQAVLSEAQAVYENADYIVYKVK